MLCFQPMDVSYRWYRGYQIVKLWWEVCYMHKDKLSVLLQWCCKFGWNHQFLSRGLSAVCFILLSVYLVSHCLQVPYFIIFSQIEVKKLQGTNLLLVVADPPSQACSSLATLPQTPVENILLIKSALNHISIADFCHCHIMFRWILLSSLTEMH